MKKSENKTATEAAMDAANAEWWARNNWLFDAWYGSYPDWSRAGFDMLNEPRQPVDEGWLQ